VTASQWHLCQPRPGAALVCQSSKPGRTCSGRRQDAGKQAQACMHGANLRGGSPDRASRTAQLVSSARGPCRADEGSPWLSRSAKLLDTAVPLVPALTVLSAAPVKSLGGIAGLFAGQVVVSTAAPQRWRLLHLWPSPVWQRWQACTPLLRVW
jgi:hypothetical protein